MKNYARTNKLCTAHDAESKMGRLLSFYLSLAFPQRIRDCLRAEKFSDFLRGIYFSKSYLNLKSSL